MRVQLLYLQVFRCYKSITYNIYQKDSLIPQVIYLLFERVDSKLDVIVVLKCSIPVIYVVYTGVLLKLSL